MDDIIFVSGPNNEPMVSSRHVAVKFGREHRDVLRAYKNIVCHIGEDDFSARNFALATYSDEQGKPREEIQMTKDGFTLLAMGFTGEDAVRWKIKFIQAFNDALGSIADLRNEIIRKEAIILQLQKKKERRYMVASGDCLEGFEPPLVSRKESELSPEEVRSAKQMHVIKTLKGIIQKHILEQGKQDQADLISILVRELLGSSAN
jgi:Rha family phage regulatory protein